MNDKKFDAKDIKFIFLLVILAFLVLFASGASSVITNDDEALYVGIAREMFQKNEWWVPKLFNEAAFYKPPLVYWIIMVSFYLFGPSLFAARFLMILISVLTVVVAYFTGRELFAKSSAFTGAACFATSLGFVTYGANALMDMPLTFFITLAVFCFIRALRGGSGFWSFAAFAVTGISTLVKGPISAVILMIFVFITCLVYKRFKVFFNFYAFLGAVTGLLFCFLWPYMLFIKGYYPQWYGFFVIRENLGKFGDNYNYGNVKFLYYIFQHMIPWLFFVILSCFVFFQKKLYKKEELGLILLWAASIVLVFIFPKTKLKHFLLPVSPAAALFMAGIVEDYKENKIIKTAYAFTAIFFMFIFILSAAIMRLIPRGFIVYDAAALIFLLICVFCLYKKKLAQTAFSYGAYFCLILAALSGFNFEQIPDEAAKHLQGGLICVVERQVYNFEYKFNKKVTQIQQPENFAQMFNGGCDIIISQSDMEKYLNASSIKKSQLDIKYSWVYWKKDIPFRAVILSFKRGDISPISEKIFIIRKRCF